MNKLNTPIDTMPHRLTEVSAEHAQVIKHPHVVVDRNVFGGSPHIRGSRVPVRRLWIWHKNGASIETLMKRYPQLGSARVLDALAFAYDNQGIIEADSPRESLTIVPAANV